MCKQKIKVGLLLCSLSMGQAFGMEQALDQLTFVLNDLRDALQGDVPPPPPPYDEPQTGPDLPPPPPPPQEGQVQQVFTGTLPPPPQVQPPVQPSPTPKTPVQPAVKPDEPGAENIPPQQPSLLEELKRRKAGEGVLAPGTKVPAAVKPTFKVKPSPKVQAQVAVPTVTISMAPHINVSLQQLRAKPTEKVGDKAAKKAFARGVLNGILGWVEKKKQVDQPLILSAVKELLSVDPLLISTAELVLERAGFSKSQIYAVMTELYQERVNFIGQEINKIKLGTVYAGIREDIDEAIAYPIELSGALQHAKNVIELGTPEKPVAQDFVARMADLKRQLCNHITQNIDLFDPMYREFYRSFCAEGVRPNIVYCITAVQAGVNEYVSMGNALKDVLNRIDAFKANQKQYWASKRIFEIQYIVNTLTGFIDFFTDPKFCKICLVSDINTMKQEQFMYFEKLDEIKQFLLNLSAQEQNVYLQSVAQNDIPRLKDVLENPRCKY